MFPISSTPSGMDVNKDLSELSIVVFSYPSIDNHAHAILREENKNAFPFEGLITEARSERALKEDAIYTVACFRATGQLSKLFNLGPNADWEFVKAYRNSLPYERLCRVCLEPTKIQCILIDDGLGGADKSKLYDYRWHDRLTGSPTKRIVRVETLAEVVASLAIDPRRCTDFAFGRIYCDASLTSISQRTMWLPPSS